MWQYSDSGIIEGIDHTQFDISYSYKDYPTLIKEYGFNGYESDFTFPDTGKSFVWIIHTSDVKVRETKDYYTVEGYNPDLDVIGYAPSESRYEIVEQHETYVEIIYNGDIAYITANTTYVSFTGL